MSSPASHFSSWPLSGEEGISLGRVLISGADRRFGCPKLHPQRRLTLLALGVEGGRVQWRAGAHSRPPVTPEWWGRDSIARLRARSFTTALPAARAFAVNRAPRSPPSFTP